MNTEKEPLLEEFVRLCEKLKGKGWNVISVLSKYSMDDADFTTLFHTSEQPEYGVSEDHVVLDSLREIAVEWSNANHEGKLAWTK